MENLGNNLFKIFKGAGWLLGFALSITGAFVVLILSSDLVAAISAAIPIGIFAGISLEQKFQSINKRIDHRNTKMMINFLMFGFIIFAVLLIVLKHF